MTNIIHRPHVRYHRNGCTGESFYCVTFDSHRQRARSRRMVATVFDAPGCCAVLCLDAPLESWRGDYYESKLRAAIQAAEADGSAYQVD